MGGSPIENRIRQRGRPEDWTVWQAVGCAGLFLVALLLIVLARVIF